MGCGTSSENGGGAGEMTKSETALKAAILIQRWYRRYQARLEARRRTTWTIFQSIEYAGEQDQLKLYNFFHEIMMHLDTYKDAGGLNIVSAISKPLRQSGKAVTNTINKESLEEEDAELMKLTDPSDLVVGDGYTGPHLTFPLTHKKIAELVKAFEKKQIIHAKYVLELLHETRKVLKKLPNINKISVAMSKQLTICGDIHGSLDDLLIVFYKNGVPGTENPYLFNGDYVDRGPRSVEVAIILFSYFVLTHSAVFLNRGNHEDHVMNLRYGFIKEVMSKYKTHAPKVIRLFEDVFSWLPLASIVENQILVTHGGISDKTDITYLSNIDRHKYLSALRAPIPEEDLEEDGSPKKSAKVNLKEWRQILDILWSDPKPQDGCSANTFRGGGSYWGPDVTEEFLKRNNLKLLVRSHECKPDGYEYDHNDKVLTIFSASNYYEVGSNKGAYVKLGLDLKPRMVQFMASKGHPARKVTVQQRLSVVEESALKSLRAKIFAHETELMEKFKAAENNHKKGTISVSAWADIMASTLNMHLPWRSLRSQLVQAWPDGDIEYKSLFDEYAIKYKANDSSSEKSITEALYRNKENLETIFRAIDKDHSGYISLQEFTDACTVLSKHIKTPISNGDIKSMVKTMDMNQDGFIDFNEFLEAFRIVDHLGKEYELKLKRQSEGTQSLYSDFAMLGMGHIYTEKEVKIQQENGDTHLNGV